jgi:hypothetical protein
MVSIWPRRRIRGNTVPERARGRGVRASNHAARYRHVAAVGHDTVAQRFLHVINRPELGPSSSANSTPGPVMS